MVVYDVLNDIWTDVYGIYAYYQDIEHVYQYLISVFWHGYCIQVHVIYIDMYSTIRW